MVPIRHSTVQGLQVKGCNHLVSLGEVLHVAAHTYNFSRKIRARHHIVFHWERVLSGGNSKVAEVESYILDSDQDFLSGGFGHVLFANLKVLDGSALGQSKNSLCGHSE